MKTALEHPGLISLAAGFTDNETLPLDEARALLDEILEQPKSGRSALQYGSTPGDLELRRLTAENLWLADGASARADPLYAADRLLITHGSQQFLYLVTEALCDPGDIVLVEDPTYFVYLGIVQSHGLGCRGLRLEHDGLDLGHLEMALRELKRTGLIKRLKLLYLVSYHQNPSGITTSFAKKTALLELLRRHESAAGHPIYLLEDAAYRSLRFAGEDVPSALAAVKKSNRVIYTSTYSKPFATGVRVGYGLLPPELFAVAARIKGNHDFGTAHLLQKLLARALRSGYYAAHLPILQARYAAKAAVMAAALRRHFPPAVTWRMPTGGLYFWAQLPKKIRAGPASEIFKAALRNHVLYVPGVLCYADDPTRRKPDHEMRLSFGNATVADMRKGIDRLGKVIKSRLNC
jgi:2-aminoadipate transaminase